MRFYPRVYENLFADAAKVFRAESAGTADTANLSADCCDFADAIDSARINTDFWW